MKEDTPWTAKRRKNKAHGASRGRHVANEPAPEGLRNAMAPIRKGRDALDQPLSLLGRAPIIRSQNIKISSPNCNGVIHRETNHRYGDSNNDIALFRG